MWARYPFVVTVHSAGVGVDEYGDPVPSSYTSATARGDYQPVNVDETRDGGGNVITDEVKFILEPSAVAVAVKAADRLEVDGQTFEVIGPPDARITGSPLDHVRARARRTG